jgi:hypothetical protein
MLVAGGQQRGGDASGPVVAYMPVVGEPWVAEMPVAGQPWVAQAPVAGGYG